MKKLFAVLFVGLVFVVCHPFVIPHLSEVSADGGGGIPLPSGQFSIIAQGSLAICLDPSSLAEEPCSASGALVVPISILNNGAGALDTAGNACFTFTEIDADLPVNASPPTVSVYRVAGKLTNYDSTTGTGDGSFATYSGGQCNGTSFNSSGATQVNGGTDHFVVSENGKRVDFVITSLTNPAVGDFSFSGTELRQTRD